ncbi:TonB-dependent receptor [Gilvimarinus sp. F26214L]|uniref:TonB-dependent receptor n=1 Tax=Gilvimarinus sp. DZF01 TaxID=3461371 RepID=UPI0040464B13
MHEKSGSSIRPSYPPHRSHPLLVSTLAALPVLFSVSSIAQQSVIEEIVVSAQKREQNMQDVSVAVSAFSGDAIEKMGFEEGLDITQQVPNMNFFAIFGEASSPSVSLRGISLVNFSDSWESPVSLYVDDVYRGNPAGSAIQLFDLERVEVLRGPQGIIYGRNTTGGLVHYLSRDPTENLEASASVSFGNYDERIIEGFVSGPISDGVRGRIAVKSTTADGWQTNVLTGEELNNTDNLGYRAKLALDVGTSGELLLNVHGSEADQKSVGFAHMGYLRSNDSSAEKCPISLIHKGLCTSTISSTEAITGAGEVNGNFDPEHVASSASGGLATRIDTFGTSITYSTGIGDSMEFTSVTAYEELDKLMQDDGDGTSVVFFDEQYSVDAEQYSQEFRLNGNSSNAAWVTGLYYYKDDRGLVTQAPTAADAAASGGFFHTEVVALDTLSWALFGQLEYELTPELTAVVGARYTDEEREFRYVPGPLFSSYTTTYTEDDLTDDAITGRLGLDWRPAAGTLVYASLSTGYKSGGYSGSYNARPEALAPVDAEEITNLELGLKTELADGRMRLNGAVFAYEVEDFQSQLFITVDDGSRIINAGDVRGRGAEVEVTAQVSQSFELIAGLGLLDTEFESDILFPVAGDIYPLDGNELPSAPGLTYNLVARYYLGLGDAGDITLQADYAWQDEHYLQVENDPYSWHDSYGLANAKVSWHSLEGTFAVEAFVNNLANEEYFTYQNTLWTDWGYAVWGKPRTYGARFSWTL